MPQCMPYFGTVVKYNRDVIPCCNYRTGTQYTPTGRPGARQRFSDESRRDLELAALPVPLADWSAIPPCRRRFRLPQPLLLRLPSHFSDRTAGSNSSAARTMRTRLYQIDESTFQCAVRGSLGHPRRCSCRAGGATAVGRSEGSGEGKEHHGDTTPPSATQWPRDVAGWRKPPDEPEVCYENRLYRFVLRRVCPPCRRGSFQGISMR